MVVKAKVWIHSYSFTGVANPLLTNARQEPGAESGQSNRSQVGAPVMRGFPHPRHNLSLWRRTPYTGEVKTGEYPPRYLDYGTKARTDR